MSDDIASRLKGIKGQALKDLAQQIGGVRTAGVKTQAGLRDAIVQSVQLHGKRAARTFNNAEGEVRNLKPGEMGAVGQEASAKQAAKIHAAIDKVAHDAQHVKRLREFGVVAYPQEPGAKPPKQPKTPYQRAPKVDVTQQLRRLGVPTPEDGADLPDAPERKRASKPRAAKPVNPNVEAVRNLNTKAMGAKRKVSPEPAVVRETTAPSVPARPAEPAQSRPFFQPTPEPKPTVGQRAKNAYGKASAVLGPYAVAKQFIDTYNRDVNGDIGNMSRKDAVIDAAKTAAPGAALLASGKIASVADAAGDRLFALARHAGKGVGTLEDIVTSAATGYSEGAVMVSADVAGLGAKAVARVAKVASRAALPFIGAISAYKGAQEDNNVVRGAGRGVVRTLDPTSIFMDKGLGERMYDAAFGSAAPAGQQVSSISGPVRLSEAQKSQFAEANTRYKADMAAPRQTPGAPQPNSDRPKGWGPEARIAAYQARNPMGSNAPYGGDPTKAPGYVMPTASTRDKG